MNTRNIFIVHGSYGNPKENWFPWLKMELEKLGHRVFVPQFPVPKVKASGGHKLDEWIQKFQEYKEYLNEDTILVSHSKGCIFAYVLLEELSIPLRAAFLVGPYITWKWYPPGSKEINTFQKPSYDWQKIRRGAKHIEIFQSTNDITPVEEGKDLADKLHATLHVVKNAGHFNVATDLKFKEFDLLLEHIKRVI